MTTSDLAKAMQKMGMPRSLTVPKRSASLARYLFVTIGQTLQIIAEGKGQAERSPNVRAECLPREIFMRSLTFFADRLF